MYNIALSALEAAINQYLRLDPNTVRELQQLQGKTVQISLTDWDLQFYLKPSTNGLNLYPADEHTIVDTVIKGKLSSLVSIGLQNDMSSKTLVDNQITISGDHKVGEALRHILQKIEIDWEDHLANLTNDSFAHLAATKAKKLFRFTKSTIEKLQQQMYDYIHQEARLTPTEAEIKLLYQNIQQLRDDTERLDIKISRLTNKD